LRPTFRTAALLLVLTATASAEIITHVTADGIAATGNTIEYPPDMRPRALHGEAKKVYIGLDEYGLPDFVGDAFVEPGYGENCPSCALGPDAYAAAAADGSTGRIRAVARAVDPTFIPGLGSGALAYGRIVDYLIASGSTLTLDVELHISNVDNSPPGEAALRYYVAQQPEGDRPFIPYIEIVVVVEDFDAYWEIREMQFTEVAPGVFLPMSVLVGSGTGIPARIRHSYTLQTTPDMALPGFESALWAEASCGHPFLDCYAEADAGNTAYLKISGGYTSLNGYRYLGADASAAIPEPATFAMTIAGILLLGTYACRTGSMPTRRSIRYSERFSRVSKPTSRSPSSSTRAHDVSAMTGSTSSN
jgi:hypothetical protein